VDFEVFILPLYSNDYNWSMEIRFDKKYLEELYLKGETSDKKHRFQPQIIAKYRKTVDLLESLSVVEDLFRYHSLHYESLVGDKAGLESVRVNDQYRVEFKTTKVVSEVVVTVCNIIELSNHYK
jgi:toxin HigB-1